MMNPKNRFISPALEDLSSLKTSLTEGERKVLELFHEKLSPEWEIYIQPHLNGLRPDFVLLNPKVGIAVFEVKDWNLDAMPYRVEFSTTGLPELWATSKTGQDFRVKDNPVEKAMQYKESIANLYCPRIAHKSASNYQYQAVITAGVIMTKAPTKEVKQLFQPFVEDFNLNEKYHPITGKEELENKNLDAIFPSSKWGSSKLMESQLAKDLRSWLIEPEFAKTQRQPLELNETQKRLINSRTDHGFRRIKGSAGSGKSLVLAGRAAQLSAEGKEVLVVSYNITLWHYLRDLAVRHDVSGKRVNSIVWCHFHEWCKQICYQAGFENEYRELWRSGFSLETILEKEMVNLVNWVITQIQENFSTHEQENYLSTYDAILVDEGQDYNLDWWNTLRRICRKGGEMLLVADETQDLYQRTQAWTEEKMNGAGFRGRWARLDTCYRTPNHLIPYLRQFAETYLEHSVVNLPEPDTAQTEMNLAPVQMRWIQVERGDTAPIATQAVLEMPVWSEPDTVSYSDIVLLTQDHRSGLRCVELLKQEGINAAHVFGTTHQEKKGRKIGFYMGDARVKAATIHSFKGWESSSMVIEIKQVESQEDLATIYVAISRLKRRINGSYLTVVCSAPQLEAFGQSWDQFEKVASSTAKQGKAKAKAIN